MRVGYIREATKHDLIVLHRYLFCHLFCSKPPSLPISSRYRFMLIHYRVNIRTKVTTIFIKFEDISITLFWCSRDDANMTYLSAINYRVFNALSCIPRSVELDDHTLKALFDCVSYSILKSRWAIFYNKLFYHPGSTPSLVICTRLIASRCRAMLAMLAIVLTGKPAYGWQHDDVVKWNHFPCYWPFVRGIHRTPVNSPHKCQWRGAFMFSLICAWINRWVNNREVGDLRRYRVHYDVHVMKTKMCIPPRLHFDPSDTYCPMLIDVISGCTLNIQIAAFMT